MIQEQITPTEVGGLSDLEQALSQETEIVDVGETKSFWQKLSDWYFQPKSFEKGGKLYEALGIKWFRKYCPNQGSYWTQRWQKSMVEGRKKEDLETFVDLTKRLEGAHVIGAIPYTALPIVALMFDAYAVAAIFGIADIAVNLYPIMSQRYNRNRANQLLERLEEREARKMLAP